MKMKDFIACPLIYLVLVIEVSIASDVYDLCIIGAGLFGSAAARHASADASLKVCLIGPEEPTEEEKSGREIFSSYYDEGRIVHNAYPDTRSLAQNTIKRFREIEKLSGIDFYHPVGLLSGAKQDNHDFLGYLYNMEVNNVPFLALDKESEVRKRYPFLNISEFEHKFLDDNGAGHINPRNLVKAQKKIAEMQGCRIFKEVVSEVEDLEEGVHKVKTEKGRIIKAKRVLFATGAFSKFKNLRALKRLDITAHKATAALIEITAKEAERLSAMPSMILHVTEDLPPTFLGGYILPPIKYPDGKFYLKIGPLGPQRNSEVKSLREATAWYSSNGDAEVLDKLPKLLKKYIPGLAVERIKAIVCVTCSNPTGRPYIDRLSPTVTVALVGNGYGATLSEEVGRLAAILSVTGKWDSDLPKTGFEAIFKDQ